MSRGPILVVPLQKSRYGARTRRKPDEILRVEELTKAGPGWSDEARAAALEARRRAKLHGGDPDGAEKELKYNLQGGMEKKEAVNRAVEDSVPFGPRHTPPKAEAAARFKGTMTKPDLVRAHASMAGDGQEYKAKEKRADLAYKYAKQGGKPNAEMKEKARTAIHAGWSVMDAASYAAGKEIIP